MSVSYNDYTDYENNAGSYSGNHALHITCLMQHIAMKTMVTWYLSGYAT